MPKIGVVAIPSNLEMIVPQPKEETNFRRDNDIEGFLVLYAGNFAQYQDFDTLLDAAKLLSHRPDITFAFVGDGAKKDYIVSRIERENISNVRMLPFVPESELSDMLGAADVSLVTLERGIEGLAVPSKFYNIMASGRTTVACVPNGSEIAHVIAEADCGVQVGQEDPAALVQVLADLADDPASLERMGQNARRFCEERYGFHRIGQQFHRIFTDVVTQNKNAAPEAGNRAAMPSIPSAKPKT